MALVWIVCGAGKGVGKTRVAQSLRGVLPGAVCAKLGCARAKLDKPTHYFRDPATLRAFLEEHRDRPHVILEVNRWDVRRLGDIVIFIEGRPGRRSVRSDVAKLRAAAHIVIKPAPDTGGAGSKALPGRPEERVRPARSPRVGGGATAAWNHVLRKWLPDRRLRRAVCAVFADQQRHLSHPRLEVRTKVWFVHGGKQVFGLGLYQLLREMVESGSLQQAAKRCGVSYRYAWGLLNTIERDWQRQLIARRRDGGRGRASVLTEDGLQCLRLFKKVNDEVERVADRCLQRFSRGTGLR
ncbi:MAG: LysR family transcriptional regulator [Planctomycetota bacterium]